MLVSSDCRFDAATSAVTSCLLPTYSALLRDELDVTVALALRLKRVRARHCRRARGGITTSGGGSCCLLAIAWYQLAVVRAIRGEARDFAFNLLEQTWYLTSVVGTVVGQHVRDDFAGVCVDYEVELPPGPTGACATASSRSRASRSRATRPSRSSRWCGRPPVASPGLRRGANTALDEHESICQCPDVLFRLVCRRPRPPIPVAPETIAAYFAVADAEGQ